jgi:hypothetical protein
MLLLKCSFFKDQKVIAMGSHNTGRLIDMKSTKMVTLSLALVVLICVAPPAFADINPVPEAGSTLGMLGLVAVALVGAFRRKS